MKISCCWMYAIERYGYPPSIEDTYKVLEDMANMGFKYVEIEAFNVKENNVKTLWENKDKLKKILNDFGLKVVSYPIMLPGLYSPNENIRKENLDLFDMGTETAIYLGVELVQLDSFAPSIEFIGETPYHDELAYNKNYKIKNDLNYSWEKDWNMLVKMFAICSKKVEDLGIKLMIEPRVGEMIANTDSILRLFNDINNPNLGAVLDTAHLYAQKELISLSIEKLGKKIFYVHVADNDSCSNDHNKLGDGTIDWKSVLFSLKKHSYSGYFSIDVRPKNINNIDREYIESWKYLENIANSINL